MEQPKYEGVVVKMAGEDYVIPPLSFKQLKMLQDDMKQLNTATAASSSDQQGVVLRIVLAALQRNYPDMTLEKLEDILDLGNIHEITQAIIGVNQLKKAMGLPPATPP